MWNSENKEKEAKLIKELFLTHVSFPSFFICEKNEVMMRGK
jgi:hypothetical protein